MKKKTPPQAVPAGDWLYLVLDWLFWFRAVHVSFIQLYLQAVGMCGYDTNDRGKQALPKTISFRLLFLYRQGHKAFP